MTAAWGSRKVGWDLQEGAAGSFAHQPVKQRVPPLALQQVKPFKAFLKLGAPPGGNLCWSSKQFKLFLEGNWDFCLYIRSVYICFYLCLQTQENSLSLVSQIKLITEVFLLCPSSYLATVTINFHGHRKNTAYPFTQVFLFKCCGFPTAILNIWCFHVHITALKCPNQLP